jgi:hypothetical protein
VFKHLLSPALSSIYQWRRGEWNCAYVSLRWLMKWLARVWCGRCGLVARVPQDRMLSRSVTSNGLDGRLLRGNVKLGNGFRNLVLGE